MHKILENAVDMALAAGATYVEARAVVDRIQRLAVRNDIVVTVEDEDSEGVGIRVLMNGAWGFASVAALSASAVERATEKAIRVAAASALLIRTPVELAPTSPQSGHWETSVGTDPFSLTVREKADVLTDACRLMDVDPAVRVRFVNCMSRVQDVWLLTSEGTRISQRHVWTGGGLKAVAVGDDDVQVRSFPNSFGGQHAAGGWEVMSGIALHSRARFTAMEAVELLNADECPERVCDLILEPSQLGLQIHESIGHAAELDRVFGHEAAFAGGTYLAAEPLGEFRLGSEHVTISADSTISGALGSFGWDDEGVPSGRQLLVDRGVFSGWLSNRETAGRIGRASSGASRASGFHRMPLVRMVNVSLEPGAAGSLEDLISSTDDGIFMQTNKSWSIDDKRLNFQFGCERAYEIRGGRRIRLLKNPTYRGRSPEFWSACDAVCNADAFELWGLTNCGKGQPGQLMAMSHGASPARFVRTAIQSGGSR